MRIIALPTGTVSTTDQIAIDNSSDGTRKLTLDTYVQAEAAAQASTVASGLIAADRPLHFSSSVTSLPKTISDAKITADHRVTDCKITGATTSFVVAWTTSAGSVVFSLSSGTFSNSTFDFNLEITQ